MDPLFNQVRSSAESAHGSFAKTDQDHQNIWANGGFGNLYDSFNESEEGFPQLPLMPLRAFDRLKSISCTGGIWGNGHISASSPVRRYDWAFACHFRNDPILPGFLLIDGLLQLTGVYAGCIGFRGKGRALKVGDTRFSEEVLPGSRMIDYEVHVRRINRTSQIIIGDGQAYVDGALCASSTNLWVKIR